MDHPDKTPLGEVSKTTEGEKFLIPKGVDDNVFSLRDMNDPRSKYTVDQKAEAVAAMCLWGTSEKAASKLPYKIPAATIRWWKTESTWWSEQEARFWKEKNGELVAGYTRALHKLEDHIADIIDNGEPVYDPKSGKIVYYKKPGIRDSVMAMAIMQDKRSVLRGEPTAISSKSALEQAADLFKEFMKHSEEIRKDKGPKIIDAEVIEIK